MKDHFSQREVVFLFLTIFAAAKAHKMFDVYYMKEHIRSVLVKGVVFVL